MAKQDRSFDDKVIEMTDSTRRVVRRCQVHHYESCAQIAALCRTGPEAAAAILARLNDSDGD